ncbi:MAG: chromo domain-containing protein, partial [Candidatus Micrarchaeaceae archaeon]
CAAANDWVQGITRGFSEATNEWSRRVKAGEAEAKRNLITAQEEQRRQANKTRRAVQYQVGDEVLLETRNLSSHSRKLRAKFIGPFKVTRVISDNVVELALPPSIEIHPRVNIERIKPFVAVTDEARRFPTRRQVNRQLAPLGKRKEKEWEVEEIVNERKKGKKVEFLVVWRRWPIEDSTWEPAANLQETAALDRWESHKQKNGGRVVPIRLGARFEEMPREEKDEERKEEEPSIAMGEREIEEDESKQEELAREPDKQVRRSTRVKQPRLTLH